MTGDECPHCLNNGEWFDCRALRPIEVAPNRQAWHQCSHVEGQVDCPIRAIRTELDALRERAVPTNLPLRGVRLWIDETHAWLLDNEAEVGEKPVWVARLGETRPKAPMGERFVVTLEVSGPTIEQAIAAEVKGGETT